MKKRIYHTVKKVTRDIAHAARGTTSKKKLKELQQQRAAERKKKRDAAIARFDKSMQACDACEPTMERNYALRRLVNFASSSQTLHKNNFRIHKPELRERSYAAMEKILKVKEIDEVRWENYYPVCKVNPQAADLWQLYPEKFDLTNEIRLQEMAEAMPKEMRKKGQVSYSCQYYIGPFIDEQKIFPIAHYTRGNVVFMQGDHVLSQKRMAEHLTKEYSGDPTTISKWMLFMQEAQHVFGGLNTTDAPKKKRNPIWGGGKKPD